MSHITQQVLSRVGPVNITRDNRVNRSNVVEFQLYPNGDISDIRSSQVKVKQKISEH